MNEQYCIDWINSLDIPETVFIDRIEDLYKDNNILLNIISKVLNKNPGELLNILGATKSINFLENIASIMNLYFDYFYDYTNKDNLNKNTILLIRFLKTRYPKEIKNNENLEDYEINNKNSINNYRFKAPNNINNDNINTNYNQRKVRSNNNRNNNIKQNNNFKLNKYKEKLKTYNEPIKNINNYPDFNFKTTPNRNNYIENTTNYLNSNNSNKIIVKKDNSSFFKEISNLFPNQIYKTNKLPQNKSQQISLKDIQKSTNTKNKNSKSLSSIKTNKYKKAIKTENNFISDNFIKKVMTSKIPNYLLKTIGKPILKKDDYFYYYQFPKITSPVTQISIEPINKYNQITKNNYYKFPFLLQNLMNQKNRIQNESDLNKNKKIQKKGFNNININELEKKERLILNYLNEKGIINIEQKNSDYLWNILIPDLKDGYIIGKIINLLEKKNKNYLKGVTKETFYKINIYYNWQKIIEFLINKNTFNSIYLYQKNFYSNDNKLFNFLYDLLKFYYEKENLIKNKFQNYNQKSDINISNIPNISTHNLINNSNISKNISNLIDKSKSNNSFNSIPVPKNNRKIHEKMKINKNIQGGDFKMSSPPSISEIMNIRKSINYVHRGNNSLVLFSKKDKVNENKKENNLNKSEDYINIKSKEKFYIKGENISFDKNVNNIISFLNLIGINTSQINFYLPEMKIFKDGILLYQIITQLESNSNLLPKIEKKKKNPSTAINNHRLIINFLNKYKKNFPIELTGKERELYKSNPKFILKFLNILRNIYNNEVYYYEKLNIKNKINDKNQIIGKRILYPKNIDKSERITLPLSQELRDKFLVKGNAKIWA